jgi:hypothetical protein
MGSAGIKRCEKTDDIANGLSMASRQETTNRKLQLQRSGAYGEVLK